MDDNLILEGLLSMVTELKEKQEAQITPASREETLERFDAIEQALSELHNNPAVPEKDLQAIRSQLDDIRNRMQGQQKHIEDTKKISLETYRCFKTMIDTLNSYKREKESVISLPFYQRIYNKVTSWIRPRLFIFSAVLVLCSASICEILFREYRCKLLTLIIIDLAISKMKRYNSHILEHVRIDLYISYTIQRLSIESVVIIVYVISIAVSSCDFLIAVCVFS